MRRSIALTAILACTSLALSGCGDPQTVTYVDPNPPTPVAGPDSTAPVAMHGPHVLARARAIEHIRAGLLAARSLAPSHPNDARAVVQRVIEEDLPTIEPRLHERSPQRARSLRRALEQVVSAEAPGPRLMGLISAVDAQQLAAAHAAVIPAPARKDPRFRGMVLYETLQDASVSYEEAYGGGTQLQSAAAYELAYGLVLHARTTQASVLPEPIRSSIRTRLLRVSQEHLRSALPPPSLGGTSTDAATGVLGVITDDVAAALGFDPSYPVPEPSTTGQLEALKRAVAAAVEARRRGRVDAAIRQLHAADDAHLTAASASIAAVSEELVVELERGLLISLPTAFRGNAPIDAAVLDLDASIDEATSVVTEELELQREAEEQDGS